MPYEYPTSVNMTGGLTDLFIYINLVTNNWFANMILISIFIIFASGFYFARRDIFGGFAVGGFAVFVFGTLFWLAGLVSGYTLAIAVAVAIVSFASLWLGSREV